MMGPNLLTDTAENFHRKNCIYVRWVTSLRFGFLILLYMHLSLLHKIESHKLSITFLINDVQLSNNRILLLCYAHISSLTRLYLPKLVSPDQTSRNPNLPKHFRPKLVIDPRPF